MIWWILLVAYLIGIGWVIWEFAHAIPYDEEEYYFTLKKMEELEVTQNEHGEGN